MHKLFYIVLLFVLLALIGCQQVKENYLNMQSPITETLKPTAYGKSNNLDFADFFSSSSTEIKSPIDGKILLGTGREGTPLGKSGKSIYINSDNLQVRIYFNNGDFDIFLNNTFVEKGQIIGQVWNALPKTVSPNQASLRMNVLSLDSAGELKSVNLKDQLER